MRRPLRSPAHARADSLARRGSLRCRLVAQDGSRGRELRRCRLRRGLSSPMHLGFSRHGALPRGGCQSLRARRLEALEREEAGPPIRTAPRPLPAGAPRFLQQARVAGRLGRCVLAPLSSWHARQQALAALPMARWLVGSPSESTGPFSGHAPTRVVWHTAAGHEVRDAEETIVREKAAVREKAEAGVHGPAWRRRSNTSGKRRRLRPPQEDRHCLMVERSRERARACSFGSSSG